MTKTQEVQVPEEVTRRVQAMTDDELYDELHYVVNKSRFSGTHDRALAVALGEECRKRGMMSKTKGRT